MTQTSDKLDGRVLKIAGVVVLGAIMSILDVTVVGIALPTFQQDFATSPATAAWTMTGYTLALASIIPVTGWAADRFGTKRLYMAALIMFVAGSVLCSTATSIGQLIVYRVLQGLGGGMLMPLGMTIMTRAAGPERIGRVMAVLGIPMLLGPIGGPILGGWLIDIASWHWIFLINVPVGIAALIYAQLVLPKDQPHPSERFDFIGMALLSPGLAAFLFGVSSIPEEGTVAAPKVLIPALAGLALIIAFVFHSLRKANPLIDLHLFKNRQMSTAVVAMSLFAVAFMGAGSILFPSYFIQVRHEDTLTAGLLLAPQGLGAMVTMPIAGAIADRKGPGRVVIPGLVLIALGMFTFTQMDDQTPYWLLLGSLFVMGLGLGATMMPIMAAAIRTLKDHAIARGSTLMNIVQQIAASIGTAVMSVVLTNQFLNRPEIGQARAAAADEAVAGQLAAQLGGPDQLQAFFAQANAAAGEAFANTFVVALVLVVLTLIPALMLPRRPKPLTDEPATEAPPAMMH
ncbi:DHA2 family efflux MFS transporter permease subunit [Epidermidibacterium keratini]|uniref:DHA2 family efflux MFS transporter permease subunit n=1 Tax=Epidermidibacterium keratini TaxID=1891644 RepID=A0A7L4YKB2_9ACTN|nr:DHA2 family efflux MFS transporter permease subunit [Epidermidibacterium keratini]QHB99655.1 DHA2 family efflux MFS transporter permease subunit [Epidermidibacterium keratini]